MLADLPSTSRIVQISQGLSLDSALLRANVAARAAILHEAGVRDASRVVICHDDPPGILVDILAAWELGAAAVPVSTSLLMPERRRLCDRLKPVLWISREPDPSLPNLMASPVDDSLAPDTRTGGKAQYTNRLALILMTSGTTGIPKGVMLTHGALAERLRRNIEEIGRPALERTLQLLPLHFGHGLIGNALTPLAAGGSLHLGLQLGIPGLSQLGATIDEHGISFLTSVPSVWRAVLRSSPPPEKGSLQRVQVGSERLPSELWRRIGEWTAAPVFNMYGMTETANWIGGADGAAAHYQEGSVGRPWGGAFKVRTESGVLADAGTGEVLVNTPSLMAGYLDDREATADAVRDGWLATGDIGELSPDGSLRLTGRAKHQINIAGIKVSAEEVDRLLEAHPQVREACAYARPDPVSGEVVAAAVVVEPGSGISGAQLRRWCAERVRAEAVPARIDVVPGLARNARGKIDRAAVATGIMGRQAW